MVKIINANLFLSALLMFILSFKTAFGQDSIYKMSKPVFVDAMLLYDVPQSYGISADVSYPFSSIIKNRISKRGRLFTRQKDRFWGVAATAYRYPYNYTGVLLMPFVGTRHFVNTHIFFETSLGVGVLRSFYDGKVYEVDVSGNVTEKPIFGRFYVTTHLSWAFNLLIQKVGSKTLALQVRPSIWFQFPFESFIKPHLSLEAGIKYEINNRSVKCRTITKHSGK